MDRLDDTSIALMHRLIGICREGEYGFRTCAQHVRSRELRTLFARHSDACHAALEELQSMQEQAGGSVPSIELSQPLRTWAALRGKVTFDSDDQILAEAVRGEEMTVMRLAEALAIAPPSLHELIERQLVAARRNEEEVKQLVRHAVAA